MLFGVGGRFAYPCPWAPGELAAGTHGWGRLIRLLAEDGISELPAGAGIIPGAPLVGYGYGLWERWERFGDVEWLWECGVYISVTGKEKTMSLESKLRISSSKLSKKISQLSKIDQNCNQGVRISNGINVICLLVKIAAPAVIEITARKDAKDQISSKLSKISS